MKTSKTHLKKALFILIIFLMSLAKVMAQSFTFGDLIYSVNSDSTSVTVTGHVNGSSATGSLIIPENVTHEGSSYAVTAIGNYAFRNSGFTGDLTVPNSVTWIGNSAFQNCSTFSSVHFYAVNCTCSTSHPPFYNCGGILTIGDNVESIPAYIFKEAAFTGSLTIGNSVTSIGTEAFCNCTGFTGSLVINSAVTTIGHRAFQQCSGFNGSLIIGSSVSSIGISAFKNCSGFSEVQYNATNAVNNNGIDSNGPFIGCTGALVIGENVETIPNYLFNYAAFTGDLTIPNSVISIGQSAFRGCSSFDGTLTISDSVEWIGDYAFENCSGFMAVHYNATNCGNPTFTPFSNCSGTIVIGENVERIPNHMFQNAAFTGTLTIPNSVTSLGQSAFNNCNGLTGLTLSNSITTIGGSAFKNCSGFTGSLTIPNSVTSIGGSAFQNCSSFTEVHYNATNCGDAVNKPFQDCGGTLTIGENVERIPKEMFQNAAFTGVLTIPSQITSIGKDAFKLCNGFTEVHYNAINCADLGYGDTPFVNCSGTLTIGENVERIPKSMFYGAAFTGNLVIPNSVTEIGMVAFRDCTGFTGDLIIPNSVTTIERESFSGCSGFTGNLVIPNSVTSINIWAFRYCSGFTGSLIIPNSVTSIGEYAFNGCSGFTEVHYNATNCASGSQYSTFGGCGGTLFIGENVERIPVNMFKSAAFSGHLTIPNSVTSIGSRAFEYCSSLTSMTIPNSISSIGQETFCGCSGLTSVFLPNSITSIGNSAFSGCSGLTSISIPNSVTSIGGAAFSGCSGLTSLTIPNSVSSINTGAFKNCSGLIQIVVEAGNAVYDSRGNCNAIIRTSGNELIMGCLNTIIPNSVTSIGSYAFSGFSSLTLINIPSSMTAIGYQAFNDCIALSTMTVFAETPPSLSSEVFRNVPKNIPVYVPDGTVEAYQTAYGWNEFTNYVEFGNYNYISVSANPSIGGNVSGKGVYENGTTCTLSATARLGYHFVNWTKNNEVISTEPTYSFTVTENAEFVANFECNTLGNFTYLSPTDNYPITSLPVIFSWDAVPNAQHYDLYLWNANDAMPEEPYVSGLSNGYYRCNSLPNYQTYLWYIKAYNSCNEITSNIRTFTLDVVPAINVNMSNIDFGEVTLNHTASTSLNIEGVVLEDIIQIQLIGEDASMFSFTTAFGWDDYTGGSLLVNFTPTVSQYEFHATLVVSSGTLTQSIPLSGSVADIYVFNTYVDGEEYSMNTSIPIHGTVMDNQNNPTANVEVEIGVFVMGMRRSLQATTNASGEFFATFEPMPSESGYYTVNSGRVGNHSTAVHDEFNIPGMSIVTDGYVLCLVTQDQPKTDTIQLRNKSNLPLNNIQVSVLSAPEGCSINFMPLSLGGMEINDLIYTINGTELTQSNQYQEIKLRVSSNEGATTDFSILYYCMEPRGILNVAPNNITATMTKGKSKIIDFMLSNHGTVATGEISINLPEVDWLSVVGSSTLPTIPVNDSAFFSLRLSPNEDIQLGQYSGSITINCEHGEFVTLPYQITVVSDSTGTLVVDVTDEYTWNTNGGFGPHLANAEVTLTGYFSLETVAHGYTNENGIFNVEQLPEGYYRLHVNADRHSEYDNIILVNAGTTNQRDVFIQYQGVTYSWEVIPTEIQDEYTYELNVDYETNVPVPVITIDFSGIHDLQYGENANCNLIFTNHGLINAYETQIYFSVSDEYTFIPLYDRIDTLPAQTTVVIPCYYYRSENDAKGFRNDCDQHCLSVSIYYCNNERRMVPVRSKPFPLGTYEICDPENIILPPQIPPHPPVWDYFILFSGINWPDCPFCPHIDPDIPPTTEEHFCTPCLEALLRSPVDCFAEPIGCVLFNSIMDNNSSNQKQILDQLSCLISALAKELGAGELNCAIAVGQNLGGCVNIEFHDDTKGNVDFIQNTINGLYYSSLYFANELSLARSFFAEDAWDDEENIIEFLDEVKSLANGTTGLINESDAQQLASTFIGTSVTYNDIIAFIDRWNRSLDYWSNGYYMISDLPVGYNTDFVQIDTVMINEMFEVEDYYSLFGYENMAEVYFESLENANTIIGNTTQSNVCASIKVQFSQKMTMTREAFEGTFTVHNGHDANAMEGIGLNFTVKDEDGNDCTDLFQINTTSLTNLTAIDGSGSLGAGMDGMTKILFIPTKEAAPIEPKVYYFGGTFSFIDPYTSEEFVYDLFPVELTVHPSPDLYVDYFMQRDILGDDALTLDKVEPSIPAELGVIINNKGAGVAKNVILETAEPKIVDNEKGLAIDFAMYGASFNGNEAQLGLMAIPFGNIESGHTAVGEWLFTSSLLGHFVSYEAHVIHNNSYGNPDLSLVSHLDIHELIHPIRAYGDLDDSINDFLVNDVADYYDYPDSIYFSHGGRTAVGLVDDIHFNHYVTPQDTVVILTLNPSRVGWNYGVTDDPGSDKYELVSCTRRTDNHVIPMQNIWQTFVTLHDASNPIYENKLHIVDTLSNDNHDYTYTLVYCKKKELLKVEEIIGIPESDFIEYPLESFSVKFSKPIADSTFTYEDMVLKCNNGSNLMNPSVVVTKVENYLYNVNISGLTLETGYYVLNIHTLNINDEQGYNGYEGKQATWIQVLNGDNYVHITGDQTVCDNDTFEPLTSVVVGEYNVLQWKRGGVSITGANGLNYQPSEAGVYTLTVAFENGEVLTSNEVTLVSNPINEVYINDEICEGDEYILNDFIMTGLSAGIYNETLYLENLHHCDSIVSAYLVVHESPEVHIQIDTINQNGISFRLTAIGADNYEWSTGETTASIIVSPINPTTFSVVGTNSNGCSDSDEVIVSGGTGINENQTTASAIIFPNPAHNKLFIKTSSAVNAVEIFSITGTLVHKQSSNSDTIEIDVQHISSGMYFIRLIANHSVETMRFVKE